MIGRQVLRQHGLEIAEALLAGGGTLVIGAGVVVEATRAWDVGILQGIGPSAQLAGTAFSLGLECGQLCLEGLGEPGAAFEDGEHGADFAGGAAGDIDEGQQLVGSAALEALRDVVGNGKRGALQLVAEGTGEHGGSGGVKVIHPVVELGGRAPDGEGPRSTGRWALGGRRICARR
jgi:hypothetical protein